MKTKTVGIAEKLAVFFLQHPVVQEAHLFGSIAMWGDGDDVDLVLVVSDAALAYKFLERLNAVWKKLDLDAGEDMEKRYGVLKGIRNDYVFEALDWSWHRSRCHEICWNGMFQQWDVLCRQKRWLEAECLEQDCFRQPDLFLMPIGWQKDEKVGQLLPRWASKRPFGTVSFLDVMAWQARKFSPQAGAFEKHQPLPKDEEKIFKELQRREHISWSLRHRQEIANQ